MSSTTVAILTVAAGLLGTGLLLLALVRRRSAAPRPERAHGAGESPSADPSASRFEQAVTRDIASAMRTAPGPPPPTRIRPAPAAPAALTLTATLHLADLRGEYAAQSVDLPDGRSQVTLGGPQAEIALPGLASGVVILERNGRRWLGSAHETGAWLLDGLPLGTVPLPLLTGSEVAVGRWQVRIDYGRGPERRAQSLACAPGATPRALSLAEGLIAAAFDPSEARPGPAALARALAALQALDSPAPQSYAVVGTRADGSTEVAGSGEVVVRLAGDERWLPLPEGGPLLQRLALPPGAGTVHAVRVGHDPGSPADAEGLRSPGTYRSSHATTLVLPG